MTGTRIKNAYQQSEVQGKIHPVKLVDMMYTRVLSLLALVEEGVRRNDAKVRGESLGKVIAILTELNFSIKSDDQSEAAQFLRGLYSAILTQLPTVVLNNDVKIVRQATVYINKLQEIWGQTAMREAGFGEAGQPEVAVAEEFAPPPAPAGGKEAVSPAVGRYRGQQSAPKVASSVLSVSI